VIWNDEVYYLWGTRILGEGITEDMTVGRVTGVVPSNRMPKENGTANFPAENEALAEYEGELYIHHNGYWYLLTPKGTEG